MGNKQKDRVKFNCDNCGQESTDSPSHYKRKQRHFRSMSCYSDFRKNKLPLQEQHAYKGVRKVGETKQVYHRNYCKSNPIIISHLKARRYAREKGAIGSHSLIEWNALKIAYNNKCANCRLELKLTKDHITPLSKGGSDFIENIQPLCKSCNSKKHNKIIYENPNILSND